MHLTSHTDYAFRLLLYLGAHGPEPVPIGRVAESYGISFNHLAKVAQRLIQGQYLASVRGRSGGVALARDPAEVNLAEIVEHMEPSLALVECFEVDGRCPIEPACALKHVLARAKQAFMAELRRHTLRDMLGRPEALHQLLSAPSAP